MKSLRYLSSTKFTLLGMGLLAVGAALSYDNPVNTPVWVLVIPLALLAVNLLAAIVGNSRINRRGGLLVFHLALLGIVILAAVGRLTHMEAHLEMVEGGAFDSNDLLDVRKGPWHSGRLEAVRFIQGPYTVDYAPGMVRGPTRSQVLVPDGRGGWTRRVIGDDKPLVLEGYRFYTTFNKGFAPVLTWLPDDGPPVTGTIPMPPYPLFDFRQANRWTPPGGKEIRLWLELETGLEADQAWTLDPRKARGLLVLRSGGQRVTLRPGETARLPGGRLRYDRLSGWMGYKLFYDPTLQWLFVTAILGVLGLGVHFWNKFATHPWPAADQGAGEGAGDDLRAAPVAGGKQS